MQKILSGIEKYTLYLTLFLVPLIVLPLFPNIFDTPKIALLVFGITIFTLIKAVRVIYEKRLSFSFGKYDLPVLIFALSYLVSGILRTSNKMDAFFLPGTATIVLGACLFYFYANQLNLEEKRNLIYTLFVSGILVSLISLAASLGLIGKIPKIPNFLKDVNFNPLGSNLPAVLFLTTTIPLGIGLLTSQKQIAKRLFIGIFLVIIVLSIVALGSKLLPGKPTSPSFLSLSMSWSIAVDSIKESPIFGVGPGNYLTSFGRFKTIDYNKTAAWNILFPVGRDFYLTHLTETGFLGLLGLTLLILAIVKSAKAKVDNTIISIVVILIILAVFPSNLPLLLVLFTSLAVASETKEISVPLTLSNVTEPSRRIFAILLSLPLLLAGVGLLYFGGRALYAEYVFSRAISAITQNDAAKTYDSMRKAIVLNPYVDRYHAAYSQINIAVAQSISKKAGITDSDRATVTQLVQQAIREGKSTVALNPQRAGNWELLGRVYQVIMPFAKGADQFAIQTYAQAVNLDPINPNLRISLGAVYYALGRYDEAIDTFKFAVLAKSDFANAHYNLAIAYREKGEIDKAIAEMNVVLSLVKKETADYQLAQTELENLKKNRPTPSAPSTPLRAPEGQGNLTPPKKVETSAIKPPIELPKEATPPATNP